MRTSKGFCEIGDELLYGQPKLPTGARGLKFVTGFLGVW